VSKATLDDIETGEVMLLRDEPGGNLFTGQVVSGIEAASVWFGLPYRTAGTCDRDVKRKAEAKTL
jgi:hypothetical protein